MSWIAVAAAAGFAKSEFVDRPAADRQRKLKANQEALSGWTGRAPTQTVKEADPLGSAMTYGMGTAQFKQGAERNDAENNWLRESAKHGGYGSSVGLGGGGGAPISGWNYGANPNAFWGM